MKQGKEDGFDAKRREKQKAIRRFAKQRHSIFPATIVSAFMCASLGGTIGASINPMLVVPGIAVGTWAGIVLASYMMRVK